MSEETQFCTDVYLFFLFILYFFPFFSHTSFLPSFLPCLLDRSRLASFISNPPHDLRIQLDVRVIDLLSFYCPVRTSDLNFIIQ